jgi:arsenate reductase-like glutaredoxin family protein
MDVIPMIKLYGAKGCHKTQYYKLLLDDIGLPYKFLEVEQDKVHAEELRRLYENRRLNFPTITIGKKKLRNPYKEELIKWLDKLIPNRNSF